MKYLLQWQVQYYMLLIYKPSSIFLEKQQKNQLNFANNSVTSFSVYKSPFWGNSSVSSGLWPSLSFYSGQHLGPRRAEAGVREEQVGPCWPLLRRPSSHLGPWCIWGSVAGASSLRSICLFPLPTTISLWTVSDTSAPHSGSGSCVCSPGVHWGIKRLETGGGVEWAVSNSLHMELPLPHCDNILWGFGVQLLLGAWNLPRKCSKSEK